ncbi:Hypothetical protein PBC10988_0900 [Planctomycetales bacterium 10988]|nr:Hypothetical protein PBC10988_0900 [Planctomycetales bacterium 10988]
MKRHLKKLRQWMGSSNQSRDAFQFGIESLESRQLLAAQPAAILDVPDTVRLGEEFSLTVAFDNTSPTDVGYGPYIDLYLPRTGVDGVFPGATPGVDEYDGVSFNSATFLGAGITPTVLTFDALGQAIHPYAVDNTGNNLVVTGTPGDQLLVFQLPFGSFTADQPPAELTVNLAMSNLADLNMPLGIEATAGFQFGNTPLNDFSTDPSIVGPTSTDSISPTLFDLTKEYLGPEDETATGPNYPRRYRLTVDVADGQTLTNVAVTDLLPDNMAFLSVVSINGGVNGMAAELPTVGAAANAPDNDLIIHFDSITGTTSEVDAEIIFEFFIPEFDANGQRIINASSGDDVISENNALMEALWDPIDVRDQMGSPIGVSQDVAGPEHVLTDKAIAIQKGAEVVVDVGTPGIDPRDITPGDVVEYTLDFQISDYFSFEDLFITDVFSDGQRIDNTFTPTLSITENGVTTNYTFTLGSDFFLTLNADNNPATPATDGSTELIFRISDLLVANSLSGQMIGGLVPDGGTANDGQTRGLITFRTVVQDEYSDTYPSGDPALNEGDFITNDVTIDGAVLDNATFTPTGLREADGSGAQLEVQRGELSKEIYAVNGVIGDPPIIAAGDTITYRLTTTLSTGDFEDLSLTDFLPLPIFFADDPDADGTGGHTWTLDGSAGSTPGIGQYKFGPSDNLATDFPTTAGNVVITVDPVSNSLRFFFGDNDDVANQPLTIDILFTVAASTEPFADGLFLTNQVRQSDSNTTNTVINRDAIVQLQLTEPVLNINKGVIEVDDVDTVTLPGTINSDYLASNPINQSVDNLDAGDIVTFAITVENTGSGLNGAFDISVMDSFLGDDYVIPGGGLDLQVTRGDGTMLSFTDLGGGLFGSGIRVDDSVGAGALTAYDATSGTNILIITYNLEVAGDVNPDQDLENTATLFNYSGAEGGGDFTDPDDLEAMVVNNTTELNVNKVLTGTSLNTANNTNTEAVVGEIITYTVTIDIPEGEIVDLILEDTLDAGLAFLDILSITPSSGDVTTSAAGGFAGVQSGAVFSAVGGGTANTGRRMTLDFETITNSNTNNGVAETITIVYRAVVVNSSATNVGNNKNNDVDIRYDNADGTTLTDSDQAATVRILEPLLSVDKVVDQTTGDSGNQIVYTITVTNQGGGNRTDAYDVDLEDLLPSDVTFVSLVHVSGLVADVETPGSNIGLTWNLFGEGATSVYEITVDVNPNLAPATVITNTADIEWTSLPGDITTPQSTHNLLSTERTGDTGDPGGNANDYNDTDPATYTIIEPTIDKTILSTSRPDTGTGQGNPSLEDLAIGEEVTYLIRVFVPEVSTSLVITDDLFPNSNVVMEYVSSQVTSIGGNSTGGATSGATLGVTMLSVGASGTFDAGTNTVTFDFGTATNTASGATASTANNNNYIEVTVTARVANVAANVNTDVHTNEATVTYTGGSDTDTERTDIVEPILNITKVASTTTPDAGDTITYTVTVSHTAASQLTAYDLVITDLINDPNLQLDAGSVAASGGTVSLMVDQGNDPSDTQIVISTDSLAIGDTITITYDVIVSAVAPPNTNLDNTAEVDWDNIPSLPGDPYERRETDTDTETVISASPTVDKTLASIPNPTSLTNTGSSQHDPTLEDLAIGETVTYDIIITIPEGQTTLSVEDILPAGFDYVSHQILVSGTTNLSFTNSPPIFNNASGTLTFDFGTATNAPDGTLDADDVVTIRVVALVTDDPSNVDDADKTNTVNVDFGTGIVTDTFDVEIVEPVLQIVKTVDTGNTDSTMADADDEVTYTLTISHTGASTSDAFDLVIQDLLNDPDIELIATTVTTSAGTVVTGNTPGDTTVRVEVSELAIGDTLIISFTARTSMTVETGGDVDNTATVDFDSYPGPGGRTGDDTDSAEIIIFSNSIAGFVYSDADNDGVFDGGEMPISGIEVRLTGTDHLGNAVNLTAFTDGTGAYSFAGLRPSDAAGYTITEFVQPAGFLDGTDTLGNGGGVAGNDVFTQVVLPLGEENDYINYNFGELEPATISGVVYHDADNDGVQDVGEPGIDGVTVILSGTNDLGTITPIVLVTSGGGLYSFGDLRPGTSPL